MSMFLSVVAGQGGIRVPGAPGTLSLSAGSNAFTEINLSWSAPSDTGGGTISGYRIKKDGSVLVADTSSTGTTYTASGLAVGTSFNFNVAAINEKGTGADGNTPSLSTSANMTITTTGSPTETIYGAYKSFKYTGTGNFVIGANPNSATFDVMYVGGGGGEFGDYTGLYPVAQGGAGAGGFNVLTGQTGTVATYVCTIGAGGSGGLSGGDGVTTTFDGNDSGGGRKAWYTTGYDADATQGSASGGGAWRTPSGYSGSGSAGSKTAGSDGNGAGAGLTVSNWAGGGGGGGGGGAGVAATSSSGGNGGAGAANTYFDGTTDYYAGGGGGAAVFASGSTPTMGLGGGGAVTKGGGGDGMIYNTSGTKIIEEQGAANTGGAAGGAGTSEGYGGQGGSGVIIVRIPWGS